MLRYGYDEPKGIIIGGDYVHWQLFYDGRPQSGKYPADNADEAIKAAKAKLEEIKQDCGVTFKWTYPEDKWEVRIWD